MTTIDMVYHYTRNPSEREPMELKDCKTQAEVLAWGYDKAFADGRLAGLEEAAKLCDESEAKWEAAQIRALSSKGAGR